MLNFGRGLYPVRALKVLCPPHLLFPEAEMPGGNFLTAIK